MSRHFQDRFVDVSMAARAAILAVVLGLGLPSGALRSQPLNPLGNGPLLPEPVEFEKERFDQEIKRLEEQGKSRWTWRTWILTPGGVLVVLLMILRGLSDHAKAMEKLQDEQKRG